MNMLTYPIFRKDLFILIRLTVVAFFLQFLILLFFPFIAQWSHIRLKPVYDWFPPVQQVISVLVGLIAAGYWYAEERANNNLGFLYRLPATAKRIWREKTAAGIVCLLILWILQGIWCLYFYSGSKSFMGRMGWIFMASIFALSLFSYIVGMPISRYCKQTISVVLFGLILVPVLGSLIVIFGLSFLESVDRLVFIGSKNVYSLYYSICMVLILLILYGWILLRHSVWIKPRTRFDFLCSAFFDQNRLYLYLSGVFLLMALFGFMFSELSNEQKTFITLIISIAFAFFSIVIGVSTYSNEEKHGLRNVLYYQPVSLRQIYWVRWFCGGILAEAPIFCFIVYGFIVSHPAIPNEFHNHTIQWFGSIFLLGLLPYACAAFFTHAIRNTLYAIFESIVALILLIVLVMFINQTPVYGFIIQTSINGAVIVDNNSDLYAFNDPNLFISLWIIPFLLAGLIIGGWRMATDRELLIRNTWYRQIYAGRIYFFLLASTVVLFKTGWKDLFFLITGIDIGMG